MKENYESLSWLLEVEKASGRWTVQWNMFDEAELTGPGSWSCSLTKVQVF